MHMELWHTLAQAFFNIFSQLVSSMPYFLYVLVAIFIAAFIFLLITEMID